MWETNGGGKKRKSEGGRRVTGKGMGGQKGGSWGVKTEKKERDWKKEEWEWRNGEKKTKEQEHYDLNENSPIFSSSAGKHHLFTDNSLWSYLINQMKILRLSNLDMKFTFSKWFFWILRWFSFHMWLHTNWWSIISWFWYLSDDRYRWIQLRNDVNLKNCQLTNILYMMITRNFSLFLLFETSPNNTIWSTTIFRRYYDDIR